MEENERYELFGHCIKDNDTNARCQLLDVYKACVVLNEQDKEIQQLKQSIKQQVREEVVEQVKDYMKKHSHTIPVLSKNRKVVYNIGLTRFLEQMKGENND